jgi:hypothetical protein
MSFDGKISKKLLNKVHFLKKRWFLLDRFLKSVMNLESLLIEVMIDWMFENLEVFIG